ncbi:MAG TPA: 4Fe-4S binding protein [Symbiobacteriaceae bacterium]|nr:4Fe-4S binding protein [Symbiobacteriaceae bacterium]
MMKRFPLVRLAVQVGMLGLFLLPLAGVPYVLGTLASSRLFGVALADPVAALEVTLASGQVWGPLLLAAGLVVAVYLVLGRAFCAWVCPLGTLLEWAARLIPRRREARWLERVRPELILAALLAGSLLLGIPLFQLLSPVNLVLRGLLFGLGLEALLLALVLGVDVALGRKAWCRHFCPLGAFYGLLGRVALLRVRLDRSACNKCGACVARCPMGAGVLAGAVAGRGPAEAKPELCTRCGDCVGVCPSSALSYGVALARPEVDAPGRRAALAYLGAGAVALAGRFAVAAPVARLSERTRLRPPGAGPEPAFLAQCLRCGQCEQVCPLGSIKLGRASDGLAVGTPYIVPREQACNLCMKCVKVCPSGALAPTDKPKMGVAELDRERCFAWNGTVCRSCFNNCPKLGEALTLEKMQFVHVNADACTGCGMCEEVCVLDEPAIRVKPQ